MCNIVTKLNKTKICNYYDLFLHGFTLILKLMAFGSRRADPPKGFPLSSSSDT